MIDGYTIERVYIPAIEQSNCLNAVASKECRQKDVAGFYADCIQCPKGPTGIVDFKAINDAIIARWSVAGLVRIKNMAWKILKGDQ